MKNIFAILLIFSTLCVFSQTKNNENRFKIATEKYNSGDFEGAIEQYNQILASGFASSSLYYNLANAHYKLNHTPESIYFYEKALKLNPENEDAKNNLSFAQQMTIDAITPLPKSWLERFSNGITALFSANSWAVLSILGVIGFVLSFLCFYFLEKTIFKRIFFIGMLFFVIFSIGTYCIAHFETKNIENQQFAILFEKKIRVFSEPNAHSNEAFSLHEGTKVKILETLNDWLKIKLADGKIGWVKREVLRIL